MSVKRRVSAIAAACAMVSSVLVVPAPADAQVRIARPRPVVRTVVRPGRTVFAGGYYYPAIYRPGLWYGSFGYGPRYYGPAYSQWGPLGYGRYDLSGSMRLQVEPEETEVFIDGYYAGQVDDFDGVFQRLHLEPGEHDLELYLPGHRVHTQRLYLQPGRTFRIRHTMQPLGPGESEPARPSGASLSTGTPQQRSLPPPAGGRVPQARPSTGAQGPPSSVDGRGQEPAPGPASRAEGFGQLSLRVQPTDAEVLIDGERWEGTLDSERLNVQLGAAIHRLEIRKDGYRSYFTDVTIRNGDTLTLNVALTKQ
jgi:hypothetical protein